MARKSGDQGALLSGIGTMLTKWEICPTCGRIHEDGVVEPLAGSRSSAVAGLEQGIAPLVVPIPAEVDNLLEHPVTRRHRSVSVPWPMPPVAEGFP